MLGNAVTAPGPDPAAPAATIRILFPARHLLEGAGAAAVLRQEVEAVRAAGFRPSLVVLAPRIVPRSRGGAHRTGALHDAAAAVGATIDMVLGTDRGPRAWPALLRTAGRVVARRPFGPQSDLDLDRLTALPPSDHNGGTPTPGVLCNYASGLRAADAFAPTDRQVILLHDLPPGPMSSRLRAALLGRPNLMSLNDAEADRLAALVPGSTVHLGVPIAPPRPDRRTVVCGPIPHAAAGGPDLLFVGGMHPPNVEGITQFIRQCHIPHLAPAGRTLAVAGRVCDALQPFHDEPGLRLLGRVDDLGSLYRAARLVIVPLLAGTGVSLKTLDALAEGCAVLSTPAGLRGVTPVGALAPPFDRRWANAIERLLDWPGEAETLRRSMVAALRGPTLADTLASVLPALVRGRRVDPLPREPLFAQPANRRAEAP